MEQAVTRTQALRHACVVAPIARQRGVVLLIALIVMVAMSLAAVALMRSVDTTTSVIGNLSFRQASILPANFAIEDAAAGLFLDANPAFVARIADVRVDTPTQNYYATHDPTATGWDDQHGVPRPLQTQAAANALVAAGARFQPDQAQNRIIYVIERMCNPKASTIPADNSATSSWCDMMPPKQSPGATINDPLAAILNAQPFYRVTVRVEHCPDGPNTCLLAPDAVSFVQAMLR
jgi:type IV pilus assembly protein PilX